MEMLQKWILPAAVLLLVIVMIAFWILCCAQSKNKKKRSMLPAAAVIVSGALIIAAAVVFKTGILGPAPKDQTNLNQNESGNLQLEENVHEGNDGEAKQNSPEIQKNDNAGNSNNGQITYKEEKSENISGAAGNQYPQGSDAREKEQMGDSSEKNTGSALPGNAHKADANSGTANVIE